MKIRFYYDNVKYRIRKTGDIKRLLEKVITEENKIPGDLFFIISGDESMLQINRKFLNHDYHTDVISFDWSTEGNVNGEIYLGIDTISRNALLYGTGMREELVRVMIHGTLHLCGYLDRNVKERKRMFIRQEQRLKEFMEETG